MKKIVLALVSVILFSCNSEPTLQKYFVENSESSDFISIDLGSSLLNTEKMTLTKEDKEALASFKKMNIIAFKKDSLNDEKYNIESQKVKDLLKKDTYQKLMTIGSGSNGGSIYFTGDEDKIDEFVVFANGKDNGFVIVRILGDDMNPGQIMNVVGLIEKSNIDLEQFKPLQALMN